MRRRTFVKQSMAATLLSSIAGCSLLSSCGGIRENNQVMVLVQLDGGNDGLNTIIPLDQYRNLCTARANLLIPERKVLALQDTPLTGFHPALKELHQLYHEKKLSVVQGVGNSNPDLSHFKSTEIWQSGVDTASTIPTGWLGRYIEEIKADNRTNHPLAVQIGHSLSKALQGKNEGMGMVLQNTSFFYDILLAHYYPTENTEIGDKLSFLRQSAILSKSQIAVVRQAAIKQKNLSKKYPQAGENDLADQLKIVAQLIGGGLESKVYLVSTSGFDTHDRQVDRADTSIGTHAKLLGQVSEAIAAFQDDIELMKMQDRVIGMTYSEFGRRIQSNASLGCDHGTAAPIILFGSRLKGGLIGHNPIIPDSVTVSDNLVMQHDFRSVYSTLLKGWLGASPALVDRALLAPYPTLDLFKA